MLSVMRGRSGRAGPVRAARRLVEQFFYVAHRGGCRDRHRNKVHQMGDIVGNLPERAFERDEGADRNLADSGEIRADRQHDQMKQQNRNGNGPFHHRGEECRVGHRAACRVVAEREPAERLALQAEGFHHHLRRDVFLHHAEDRGLVDLLLVIGLHRLRRQNARADQRDRENQQRDHR